MAGWAELTGLGRVFDAAMKLGRDLFGESVGAGLGRFFGCGLTAGTCSGGIAWGGWGGAEAFSCEGDAGGGFEVALEGASLFGV